MTNRGKRILYSREDYFRSLLPDAKDEETRQALLAVIEGERGKFGDKARPDEPSGDPVEDEG